MRHLVYSLLLFTGLTLLPVPAAVAGDVEVRNIRLRSGAEGTRVVLDLDRATEHRLFSLSDPDRVVIDLPGGRLAPDSGLSSVRGEGAVRQVRHSRRGDGALRIVLDLGTAVMPRSFLLKPNGDRGHRLVVDLGHENATSQSQPALTALPPDGRDLVIAIDPGHGGIDPGASGTLGTREKDVVLDIARVLARAIDAEPGMRAVLIRDGDFGVSLRGRMEKARVHRADLFVSLHADAFRDARARGSSVYVLSERGATSEAARWLAERENAADLVGGVTLDDKDELLASVLLDLSQTAAISASMNAGEKIITELGRVGRVRKHDVQQAGFLVLKSPDIPSVLVELAFISNPEEERKLNDSANQVAWAQAILGGVRSYFRDNPPPGTRLAQNLAPARAVTHIIGRGETLGGIATRYDVSIEALRIANGLRSDRIMTGQALQVPVGTGT